MNAPASTRRLTELPGFIPWPHYPAHAQAGADLYRSRHRATIAATVGVVAVLSGSASMLLAFALEPSVFLLVSVLASFVLPTVAIAALVARVLAKKKAREAAARIDAAMLDYRRGLAAVLSAELQRLTARADPTESQPRARSILVYGPQGVAWASIGDDKAEFHAASDIREIRLHVPGEAGTAATISGSSVDIYFLSASTPVLSVPFNSDVSAAKHLFAVLSAAKLP